MSTSKLDPEHRLLESPPASETGDANSSTTSEAAASIDATPLISPDVSRVEAGQLRRAEGGVRVVSTDGSPVEGAELTWSPRSASWHARVEQTTERDWEGLLQRSVVARTNAQGIAEISTQLAGDAEGSILWVTHTSARPRSFRFSAGGSPFELALPILLDIGGSVDVEVIDAKGAVVSNAVLRTTRMLAQQLRGAQSINDIEDSLYLVRFATVNETGRATMPCLGGIQTVIANVGTLISEAWRGEAPANVTLILRSTFVASGRVRALSDSQRFGDVVINVYARTGAELRGLSSFSVDTQGAFGPQRFPILEGARYDFQAQGGEYISARKTIDAPSPDSHSFVEIPLEAGSPFPVLVVGPDDTPISRANVEYIWQVGDSWERALVLTGEDGIARMRGSPLGTVWLDIEARGFVPKRDTVLLETPVATPWRIKLDRGGTIEGVVRHEGTPVETFSIRSWRGTLNALNTRHFIGRSGGRFMMEGVPLGEVKLFASSSEHGRGPVSTVTVTDSAPTWVEIELAGCVRVSGRVVDGITGEPIADAAVQPWLLQDATQLDPFGRSATTDDGGLFKLECVPAGDNVLRINAAGFPERSVATTTPDSNALDVGTISLRRGATLDLRLILDEGTSYNGWFGSLNGLSTIAPTQFPADGVLHFENLEPGPWRYTVDSPTRMTRFGEVRLIANRRSMVEVRATGTGNVRVDIREKPGYPLKDPAILYVVPETIAGDPVMSSQSYVVPPSRSLSCAIDPRVQYQLVLMDGEELAAASLIVPVGSGVPAVLHLDTGAPTAQVFVFDKLGDPMAGVVVTLDGGSLASGRRAVSDARGIADFGPWHHSLSNLHLQRDDLGVGFVSGIEFKAREPVRIEFDPRGSIELLVLDGAPLPGVEVLLLAPRDGEYWLMAMSTDDAGRARSRALLAGDYTLAVVGESLWPVRRMVRVGSAAQTETLQVRRRGSIEFQVARGGLPLSDVAIQLHSQEFDENASDWLARDLILARPSNAATDSDGRLRFDGLPRGEYRWSVSAPDGSIRTAKAEIAPGSCSQVRIDLD